MAGDTNNNQNQCNTDYTDTINNLLANESDQDKRIELLLKSIDSSLKGRNFRGNGANAAKQSQSQFTNNKWTIGRNGLSGYHSTGNILEDFENGIRDGLLDAIAGGDFKRGIQGALSEFTNQFGFQLKDLPNQYGRHLAKQLANTKIGKAFSEKLTSVAGSFLGKVLGKENAGSIINAFKGALSGGGGGLGGSLGANAANSPLTNANAEKLFGKMDGVLKNVGVGGGIALAVFMIAMKPFFSGIADFFKAWGKSVMRTEDMRKKRLENAQKRLEADLEYIAREPFEILKKAAEEWEQTWDANLSKVALTQGYNKEDVYSLYSAVAESLNADELGKVIPATDVVNNLGKILETGLSGAIAEAFAYESTWLSAAIPTEDFTGYAATYAQVASDAINAGKSQQEAIEYANLQLEQFASNLLYSSRTLSGGFTTGLKDAQSLFKDAVEIAQTAKTHNVAEISGVLTSVSGVIGSVAPDLAQGLVQNIVQAAIGGNDSTIVALRSLAGINAGNTDFLRQMALDPQGVFVTIFRNLANMQNMSPSNYMEVAEGLSKVFGVDMKAFARVDFNQLADKVDAMAVNTVSLAENLELLKSGQSTLTADQLKYQEINNDILNNGLAYVIDSEYGRMIQQHMWDEQIANQLAENEYAVTLQGAALSMLEGLRHTVANILSFLNPVGWVADKVAQIWVTDQERKENTRQIADILERGAVGSNYQSFSNLTNVSGIDLGLVPSLITMLGGTDLKKAIHKVANNVVSGIGNSVIGNPIFGAINSGITNATTLANMFGANASFPLLPTGSAEFNRAVDSVGGWASTFGDFLGLQSMTSFGNIANRSSRYSGFNVGKSALTFHGTYANGQAIGSPLTSAYSSDAYSFAADKTAVQNFIDSAKTAAQTMMYTEYLTTAIDQGITDIESALDDYGITMEELQGNFEGYRSGYSGQMEEQRKSNIQEFIEENRGFWDYSSGTTGVFQTAMWLPFFGTGQKYDVRMDAVDMALSDIQSRIGTAESHTIISGIEELSRKLGDDSNYTVISILEQIENDISSTFISETSAFQKCLADWLRYIAASADYTEAVGTRSTAWSELKQAEGDRQNETLLALANAMNVFSADELQKMDPQLQTNALLGKIVIILEAIMQQNNQVGGISLIDSMSALAFGITQKTNT